MTNRPTIDFAEAKPFEIFRTGAHTPMNGAPIDFGDAELAAIAAAYDPTVSQAPIVVGHPKLDAPAYGWVSGLEIRGDRLAAVPEQIDPAFADLVRAGRFKTVSASFYRPGQAANPKPEGWYLRHVGFLGAQPPAVKGLRPAEFAGDDDDCLTVEFSDWAAANSTRIAARLFRSIRDWLIGSAGQEVADRVLPDWDVQSLAELPAEIDPPPAAPDAQPTLYADDTNEDPDMTGTAELEARERALQERQAEIERREAAFAEAEIERRRVEDVAVLERLTAEGRLPKAARPFAEALFAEVRGIDTTADFADGDATVTATPRQVLSRLLGAMPLPVVTGELVTGEAIDFADPGAVASAIKKEVADAAARGETIDTATAAARLKER